jgi:diaminopimelate decarboxylase
MLSRKAGRLFIDGVSAESLAARFGTPLYAYSERDVIERYDALRSAFSQDKPLICYAMKANSNRAIVRLIARRGGGADIVSGGELIRALRAGVPPERIVFSGVGKTASELALGIAKGVLTFNVESQEELDALEAVAKRLRKRAPVSVRLNPDVNPRTHPHITTGLAHNKFGVEKTQALKLFEKAAASRWLTVKGIQCHIGSQIVDVEPYTLTARSVALMARELSRRGIALELVDLGGGIGVSYRDGEKELPLKKLAAAVYGSLGGAKPPRLVLEPGRYLVADSGVLLSRVLYRKKTSKRRFVIVDAAMNDLARPALYDAYHPIEVASRRPGPLTTVDVVGPVCESTDFLARQRKLPPCEPGDVIAVLKAGAYGFAMSSQYNSRPRAAEVLVSAGKARLIRRRETMEDLTRHEL